MIDHPFIHLGPPPYTFVDYFVLPGKALLQANPEAYNSALSCAPEMSGGLGCCAHCGTAIRHVYVIRCGDGSRWGVGCDCIMKLNQSPELVDAVKKAKRKADRERRHQREQERIEEGTAWISDNQAALERLPHPIEWRAKKGETMADGLAWILQNAGNAGKLKAIRAARLAVAAHQSDSVQKSVERTAMNLCVDCELMGIEEQGRDDWELCEGVYLCCDCVSERTRGRKVPEEWRIEY